MPPHIAQLVAGHRDINTTMGYKAVYPEEAINGHRAFISPPARPPTGRGIPDPHRRRVAGVPRPLRAPQGLPGHLRPLLRNPVHPRALLPALPAATSRPRATPTTRRHPRQPLDPDRRSPPRRLARRGRRPPDQPRRGPREARPGRPDEPQHTTPASRPRSPHPSTPLKITKFREQEGFRLSPAAGVAGQHRRSAGRDAAAGERRLQHRRRPHRRHRRGARPDPRRRPARSADPGPQRRSRRHQGMAEPPPWSSRRAGSGCVVLGRVHRHQPGQGRDRGAARDRCGRPRSTRPDSPARSTRQGCRSPRSRS